MVRLRQVNQVSVWLDGKTCTCSQESKDRSGFVIVGETAFCKYCRKERRLVVAQPDPTPTAAQQSGPQQVAVETRPCAGCGYRNPDTASYCAYCGANAQSRPAAGPSPGWYRNPNDFSTQRYWNGREWTQDVAPLAPGAYSTSGAQPKSETLALVFEVIFPGAGLMYIGMSNKAAPYLVASAIATLLALTVYLSPVALIIWLICVLATAPKITEQTRQVNAAAAQGSGRSGW